MSASLLFSAMALSSAGHAKEAPDAEIRRIVSAYARCLVKYSPDKARKYVLLGSSAPLSEECLSRSGSTQAGLRFPAENYRYALAEALIALDFPAALPTGTSAVPSLHQEVSPLSSGSMPKAGVRPTKQEKQKVQGAVVWAMRVIGECVARANSPGAHRLALTEPAGSAEGVAFAALMPAIGGCLPPGTTLKFSKATLRGAVVLDLYVLAYRASTAIIKKFGVARPAEWKVYHA